EVDVQVPVGDGDRDLDDVGGRRSDDGVEVEVDDLGRSALEVHAEHSLAGSTRAPTGGAEVDLGEVQPDQVVTTADRDAVGERHQVTGRAVLGEVEDIVVGPGDARHRGVGV